MLRIKDFKFKNKEELDFAVDPECEYGCGEKMSIISNKDANCLKLLYVITSY